MATKKTPAAQQATRVPRRFKVGLYVTYQNSQASAYVVDVSENQLELFYNVNRHRYLLARSQDELIKDLELLLILGALGLMTPEGIEEATGSLATDESNGEDDTGVLSPENQEYADWLRETVVACCGSLASRVREVDAITDECAVVLTCVVSL